MEYLKLIIKSLKAKFTTNKLIISLNQGCCYNRIQNKFEFLRNINQITESTLNSVINI